MSISASAEEAYYIQIHKTVQADANVNVDNNPAKVFSAIYKKNKSSIMSTIYVTRRKLEKDLDPAFLGYAVSPEVRAEAQLYIFLWHTYWMTKHPSLAQYVHTALRAEVQRIAVAEDLDIDYAIKMDKSVVSIQAYGVVNRLAKNIDACTRRQKLIIKYYNQVFPAMLIFELLSPAEIKTVLYA